MRTEEGLFYQSPDVLAVKQQERGEQWTIRRNVQISGCYLAFTHGAVSAGMETVIQL